MSKSARFNAAPPQPIVTQLRTEADQTLAAIAKTRAAGTPVPGMDEIERGIRAALAAGRLAWLRRARQVTSPEDAERSPDRSCSLQYQELATNDLQKPTLASCAVTNGAIIVRTEGHLYRIE